ncbi:uncharacterized protein LOC100574764 [Acyrthosiphon pisum]|uniref:MYND-type domain-containing protein n=1 Tax=Acyrthosiphon pisum TaxID=7029 RepID=A0A8R2A7D4_ACYPI|nr:uncharacterized protein LOC100574764 [Acyrthosiphon pisum]|eukprot:XP_003246470.1 PREDICTED: uncharacterized protein LOC100574764 [Acyrthosiphon pisum]
MTERKMKMRNFDNSLRIYNRQVLLRTKMHTYTKKYIDNLFNNAVFNTCEVSVLKLTAEDIANYKLSLIKNKDTPKEDDNALKQDKTCKTNITSKDDKKSKVVKTSKNSNTSIDGEPAKKKQKLDTNGIDVLKMVLSREGETHKFKSQFKSALKTNKEIISTNAEVPMVIDCDEITESSNSSANNLKPRIWVIDPRKMMDENNFIKWMKMIRPDNKSKHSTNGLKKLVVAKPSTSGPKPSSNSTKVNGIKHTLNGKNHEKGALIEIENVYKKYFGKSVQDTIVIIANILNIISMSNKHHKARMDECIKKKSEAEKLKERCDANRLHGRHKKILETKLKNNFISVVSSFKEPEFDTAFQMFFLSILTVLRVLELPKFRKGSIFKNLVLLLWNSLKNSEYNHPKIYNMFRSKTFRPDCIDLISLIEDSRDTDPGVTERMSLFFVSTVNSREYFQGVINAVTSDSNDDLALLIDDATSQCCINSKFKDPVDSSTVQHSNSKIPVTQTIQSSSKFKDPVDSSTVQHSNFKIPVTQTIQSSSKFKDPVDSSTVQHSNYKIPVTQTIQNSINSETIQHWILAKSPDGTYQQIPVLNNSMSQTINNNGIEPSIATSRPINNFYTTSSIHSSLQKKASELTTSKMIPSKKCIVITPTISNSPLVQVTASSTETATSTATTSKFLTFKPSIQNKTVVNSPLHSAEGSTIVLGNKQYQLVKGPSGTMRAVVNGTNILLKSPPTRIIKCYAKDCNNSATIMCSSCTTVKYCSHNCQRLDWYASHINDCDRLLSKKLARP